MSSARQVPVDITSRHGHVSDRMEEYAIRKVERLLRFHDRISRIEFVVDGPHDAPEVELLVHVEHASAMVAKERDNHFSNAVDRVIDKVERQLIKAKEKQTQKNHRHESIRDVPSEAGPVTDEDGYEDLVRKDVGPGSS